MTTPVSEPWIACRLPARVAELLDLGPTTWPDFDTYGLARRGRGGVLLFQCSRPTLELILDRCRFLASWTREDRRVLARGDRVQVERAIDRISQLLATHYTTHEAAR